MSGNPSSEKRATESATEPGRDEKGRFVKGHDLWQPGPGGPVDNKHRLTHGGAGAVERMRQGQPFPADSLARQAELEVYDELETSGRYALTVRNAARLQACCDLYWAAVSKAAEDGDLEALDRYVKRFGWLAGSSLRAWAQVRSEEVEGDDSAVIVDAIIAARGVGSEHRDTD